MYCLSLVGKAPTSDLWQDTALGYHNPKQLSYRNWPRPRKHMICEAVMGTDEDKARVTPSPDVPKLGCTDPSVEVPHHVVPLPEKLIGTTHAQPILHRSRRKA